MKCVCLPEWSSLTSEDTVLVMESAATRRSFLRFLLGPEGQKQAKLETLYYCCCSVLRSDSCRFVRT